MRTSTTKFGKIVPWSTDSRAPSWERCHMLPVAANPTTPLSPPPLEVGVLWSRQVHITSDLVPNTNIPLTLTSVHKYLETELGTQKLDVIYRHLWWAGLRRRYIKPLHHQRVLRRDIVVSEQLHLISRGNAIYVKPIPPCLLHSGFFQNYVQGQRYLEDMALGFLSSYLNLITHESDLHIANELHLFPEPVKWHDWLTFSRQLTAHVDDPQQPRVFNNRYDFGELRLNRLNILVMIFTSKVRGYKRLSTSYAEHLRSFWSLITALVFVFLSVATSAFSVALASPKRPPVVASIAFRFAVTTLCLLGALVLFPFLWFLIIFIDNVSFAFSESRVGY